MDPVFLATLLDRLNGHGTHGHAGSALAPGEGQGHGVYTFPSGLKYEGHFTDGVFDGRGVLTFPNNGGRFEGVWDKGKLVKGKYFFADNLEYRPRNWQYCTDADRRFWQEIQHGIQLGETPAFTNNLQPREIPVGCFDIGDGKYYNPFDQCLYSEDGTFLRVPSKAEAEWAVRKARISTDNDRGRRRAILAAEKETAWYDQVARSAEEASRIAEATIIHRLRELGLGDVRVPDKVASLSLPLQQYGAGSYASTDQGSPSLYEDGEEEELNRYEVEKERLQSEMEALVLSAQSKASVAINEASQGQTANDESAEEKLESAPEGHDETDIRAASVLTEALELARQATQSGSQGDLDSAALDASEAVEDSEAIANFERLGQIDLQDASDDNPQAAEAGEDPNNYQEDDLAETGDGFDFGVTQLPEVDGVALEGMEDIEGEMDDSNMIGLGLQHESALVEDNEDVTN